MLLALSQTDSGLLHLPPMKLKRCCGFFPTVSGGSSLGDFPYVKSPMHMYMLGDVLRVSVDCSLSVVQGVVVVVHD